MLAPGAKQILWELRQRNLKIGLVSNSPSPLTGTAIELGIIEHLDFTLASGQTGTRNPEPELLKQALRLARGIQPEEAVHVGDNYYTDVIGAQRAGMHAILLDEHGVYEQCANGCLIIRRLDELLALLPS
jgi:putative hydrolase of the HAD superfamily